MAKSPVQVVPTPDGLTLIVASDDPQDALLVQGKPVHIDWLSKDTTSPLGKSLQQPILKAAGIRKGNAHRPHILDATAGYGEDTWFFASHGCRVTAVERNPIAFEILTDALRRAAEVHPDITARITLIHDDARAVLQSQQRTEIEVVHLDPMFPAGRRATERKPMRVLRRVVGDDEDAGSLLRLALERHDGRVIVKRPLKSKLLIQEPKPVHQHKGNAVRYDVYV